MKEQHLNFQQFDALDTDSAEFSPAEKLQFAVHVAECDECRNKMLPVSTVKVRQALSKILFKESSTIRSGSEAVSAFPQNFFAFLKLPFNLELSGIFVSTMTIAVLFLSIGLLLVFYSQYSTRTKEGQLANLPKNKSENLAQAINQEDSSQFNKQRQSKTDYLIENNQPELALPSTLSRANQSKSALGVKKYNYSSNKELKPNSRLLHQDDSSFINNVINHLLNKTPQIVLSLRASGVSVLRGDSSNQNESISFRLLSPIGEVVLNEQPTLMWKDLPQAKSYKVSVQDSSYQAILDQEVNTNQLALPHKLKRGEIYLWQVTAVTNTGQRIISPKPPNPPALFKIAAVETENKIVELRKTAKNTLQTAVYLAQEGFLSECVSELTALLKTHPKNKAAEKLLAKVKEWQRENYQNNPKTLK